MKLPAPLSQLHSESRSTPAGYLLAVVSCALVVQRKLMLDRYLGEQVPFLMFFSAVLLSATFGGTGPGIVAALITASAGDYFFLAPYHQFALEGPAIVRLLVYLTECAAIIAICHANRRAVAENERLNRDLLRRMRDFQTLWEKSPVGLAIAEDIECTSIQANPILEKWLSLKKGANAARNTARADKLPYKLYRDGREYQIEELPLRQAASGTVVDGIEMEVLRSDGSRLSLVAYAAPLTDDDGHVRGAIGSFVDFTDVHRAQAALKEEAAFRQAIEDAMPSGVALVDCDGRQTYVNPEFCRMVGWTAEELLGAVAPYRYWAPEGIGETTEAFERTLAGDVPAEGFEFQMQRRNGERFQARVLPSPVHAADGKIAGWLASFTDITSRRETEAALRESERLLRLIVEAAPTAISYADTSERYRFNNLAYQQWFGAEFADLRGKSMCEVIGADAYQKLTPFRETALAGNAVSFEMPIPFAHGGTRYLQASYVPDIADDGSVRGFVIVGTDVSALKRQEEAQRFLAQAGEALASSLDYETTLHSVAQLAVPHLADWCVVDLLDEQGKLKRVATAHIDPSKRELGMEFERRYPTPPDSATGPNQVIRTGQPEWLHEIDDDLLRRSCRDEEHYRFTRELGLRSYITVPLVVREKAVGAISFVSAESGRLYTQDDVVIAESLAHRASLAIDNARLYTAAHKEIAERQKAEQEIGDLNVRLRRAMTETHHRVKNNLQVISAMIDLQTLDQKDLIPISEFKRLSQHVRMLAAVHDLLTEQAKQDGEAYTVNARSVLEKLLPMVQQMAERRKIEFQVEDAALTSRQGTSLALVANEICSNAIKYGTGDIEITFSVHGSAAELRVCDIGPGFPEGFDPVKAANTGLDLVESLSRWDLQGDVRYENRTDRSEGGACVTVTIPLSQ